MERLTKRNSMGISVYTHEYMCERCDEPIYRLPDTTGEGSPTERLAEYEEMEEQELLLRLPCRVGAVIWDNDFGRPCGYHVTGFDIGITMDEEEEHEELFIYYQNGNGSIRGNCPASLIGKEIFLTREEAEQALKQVGGRKE